MIIGGVTDAILLAALGLGYIVCYLAKREDKGMQAIGYLIGTFIIVLSAILIINNLLTAGSICRKIGAMGMMAPQHKMMRGQMMPAMPAQPGEPRK